MCNMMMKVHQHNVYVLIQSIISMNNKKFFYYYLKKLLNEEKKTNRNFSALIIYVLLHFTGIFDIFLFMSYLFKNKHSHFFVFEVEKTSKYFNRFMCYKTVHMVTFVALGLIIRNVIF
jgi:hypothetical protein